MTKVCITGATGLVGTEILAQLLPEEQTYQLIACYHKTPPTALEIPSTAEKISWRQIDLADVTQLAQLFAEVDVVIHCAAMVSFDEKDKEQLYKINVEGTTNVVNACLEQKVKRLVHVSSIAAVGRSGAKLLLDETHHWEESEYVSHYARSKHLAELEVWRAEAEGLKTVIVNPSVILGGQDWERSSTQIFKYVWNEGKFFTEGLLNYVDVRDVAKIVIKLLAADIVGERFILNAGVVSYEKILTEIAHRFEKKPPTIRITPRRAAWLWRLSAFMAFFTGKRPLITREIVQTAKSNYQYDNTKIKNTLSYQFISLEDSLDWACKKLLKKYVSASKNQRNV